MQKVLKNGQREGEQKVQWEGYDKKTYATI